MPTKRSLEAAGYSEDEIKRMGAKYVCYVCGEPLEGIARRDTPNAKAARKRIVLGPRHTDCEPSEHEESSKRVMLAWKQ